MAKLSDYNMKWVKTDIGTVKTIWILQFGDEKFEDLEEIASVVVEGNRVVTNCEEMSLRDDVKELDSHKHAIQYVKDMKKYIGQEILRREEY